MVIDPSIAMLPVSCEQLLSLAGLFSCSCGCFELVDCEKCWAHISDVTLTIHVILFEVNWLTDFACVNTATCNFFYTAYKF